MCLYDLNSQGLILEGFPIEDNWRFLWFYSTSLRDWSRKPVPLSQPIKFKTKDNHDLATCVFLSSNWLMRFSLISLLVYDSQWNLFKIYFIASLPLVCQQYPLHEEHRTQSLYVQNLYPLRKHGPLMKYFDSLGILCHPGIQNFRKYYSTETVFLVWLFVLLCFVGLFFFCFALLCFVFVFVFPSL